jgi:hypothetical protein
MKDFIGQELEIGDYVAFMQPNYRNIILGKIIKFTPLQVRVSYTDRNKYECTHLDVSDNMIKVSNEDVIAMKLRGES